MIKHILFDLDGTLLPMDQDHFTNYYFTFLSKKLAPYGYDAEKLIAAIWKGTKAMVLNDGTKTNEVAFWNDFTEVFGKEALNDESIFVDFYRNEFNNAKNACGFQPLAKSIINLCKEKGFDVYLATNPIFPEVATMNRIDWAGLDANDFVHITTYENSCYCKPNPAYFTSIAEQFNLDPKECLMIGNDVIEDTAAAKIGMDVFLITDTLENKKNLDYSAFHHGSFTDAISYIESLQRA